MVADWVALSRNFYSIAWFPNPYPLFALSGLIFFAWVLLIGCELNLVLVVLNSSRLHLKIIEIEGLLGTQLVDFNRMDWLILFRFFFSLLFNRFAEFVEGKSHLSDREVLDYETTAYRESETWTDDESDEEWNSEDDQLNARNKLFISPFFLEGEEVGEWELKFESKVDFKAINFNTWKL